MNKEEKYEILMKILRRSVPDAGSPQEMGEAVIKSISAKKDKNITVSDILDFLFGWVYIPWVRMSLITASLILLAVFIMQQNNMQKQIDYLTNQLIINNRVSRYDPSDVLRAKKMMYKLTQESLVSDSVTISEKELIQILDSISNLQTKYKEILEIIGEDRSLKRKMSKKLNKEIRFKYNL